MKTSKEYQRLARFLALHKRTAAEALRDGFPGTAQIAYNNARVVLGLMRAVREVEAVR